MDERLEWVDKRSSRIWRGRLEARYWRYIKGSGGCCTTIGRAEVGAAYMSGLKWVLCRSKRCLHSSLESSWLRLQRLLCYGSELSTWLHAAADVCCLFYPLPAGQLAHLPWSCARAADGGWEPKPVGEGVASFKRRGSGRSRGSAGGATRSRGTKHSTGVCRPLGRACRKYNSLLCAEL